MMYAVYAIVWDDQMTLVNHRFGFRSGANLSFFRERKLTRAQRTRAIDGS
jgi:hypothetical protein